MSVRDVTVRNLGELIQTVTPTEPDPRSGHLRDTGVYRGSAATGRALLTSLDRLGGVEPAHTKTGLEEHLLRNFIRYSRPHLDTSPHNDWELLVTAQHHGLPTRLLDWTYSPLVAAHFATINREIGGDRVIWRLDWQAMHKRFGLPPRALSIVDLEERFNGKFGEGRFSPWQLFGSKESSEAFACMLEPPSLDHRIVAQQGTFTLCTDKSVSFERFLAAHELETALMRIIIPREAVSCVRDQLDNVGMDERRLFPDLDGVAAFMGRYYS